MIEKYSQVSRKMVEKERIAICPQFGCKHLEKVKPLKFGVLGFRKYPKCSNHKNPLVFVDEFIGDFINAVNACLFDKSSLPPEDIICLININAPDEIKPFINGWMYCNPIGRGAQIVSQYMDGLSRGYMKLLSRKQRKSLRNDKTSRKHYEMLRFGLKKIADEYTTFLQELHEKSEVLYDPMTLCPLSDKVQNIIKTWLRDYLKTIKRVSSKKRSELSLQNESLSLLKEEYDIILHAGTCALLLGKSPSIVTKAIPAFELFSAYHEFLKKGLCRELKRKDMKLILEEPQEFLNIDEENKLNIQEVKEGENFSESDNMKDKNDECEKNDEEIVDVSNFNVPNFRQKVINNLKSLHASINGTQKQKNIIWTKSLEILDEFSSRAENNELIIPKNANLKTIAATIIYTVALSNENIPKISTRQIAKNANISPSNVSRYYGKHFERLYPRKELAIYGFKRIRSVISLYFFELIRNTPIKTSELILRLEENIFSEIFKKDFGDNFRKDINTLRNMVTQYRDDFIKYFSDLAEIIKLLANTSKIHKKIGARIHLKSLVDFLKEKGINLFQKSRFIFSIREIYDIIREKYPNFFPPRAYRAREESLTAKQRMKKEKDFQRIVGSKLKLYAIKNIYNGKYFKNGKCKCPECLKEGLIINTDVSKLSALEFHHTSGEKKNDFTADRLYEIFIENQSNPHFLEWLIKLMELEQVILVCVNHHNILEEKYFDYFKFLINQKDIFSYPPELIHALIRISVDNFHKTKKLSTNAKAGIRDAITRYLKKQYIIEHFYGEHCHTCGEFSIKKHLSSFTFHHKDVNMKNVNASKLYHLSCSEIAQILEKEEGGYICSNCHRIIHYDKFIPLLDQIYNDKNKSNKIVDDYNRITREFTLIHREGSIIKNPLIKPTLETDGFMKYLIAIYENSKSGCDVTNMGLKNYLGYKDKSTVMTFFRNNYNVMRHYVEIIHGTKSKANPTKYYLNDNGRKAVSLIFQFRDYYKSI